MRSEIFVFLYELSTGKFPTRDGSEVRLKM
jgi:hypothetical protein